MNSTPIGIPSGWEEIAAFSWGAFSEPAKALKRQCPFMCANFDYGEGCCYDWSEEDDL